MQAPHSFSMEQQQKSSQTVKQLQRMIMTHQMQQAINVLQMSVMELLPAVELEMEQNPLLEYIDEYENQIESSLEEDDDQVAFLQYLTEESNDSFHETQLVSYRSQEEEQIHGFFENTPTDGPSLFDHLMLQVNETLESPKDRILAEAIIGNLDEHGFMTGSLEELAVLQGCTLEHVEEILKVIQTFKPDGIGAKNLHESLLIQLEAQGKKETLAFHVVDKFFDDFIHNRIPKVIKVLHCSAQEMDNAIKDISKLELYPGKQDLKQIVSHISADISLRQEGDVLIVVAHEASIPRLRLNARYLRMLNDETLSLETRAFIQQKIISAKWLLRTLLERSNTLEKIAEILVRCQNKFFSEPNGQLIPLSMKMVADELQLNESTVTRAVSNKYIETPRGLFPFRYFFTQSLQSAIGEDVSVRTAHVELKKIFTEEDPKKPFTDKELSKIMQDRGICCARRTIAKYRALFNIPSASLRRKY